MSISVGETILKLRKEKALTQEQLAEVFGVSTAAVSKWETGTAYPDIVLLPVIAGFFDISIDRLLGHDLSRSETGVEEHLQKADTMLREKKGKEAVAYLGRLAYKYPNHIKVLVKYAEAKIESVRGAPPSDAKKKMFREAESLLRSINTHGLSRRDYDNIMGGLYLLFMREGRYDEVEKILVEIKPAETFRDFGLAEFWFYANKKDMAIAEEKYFAQIEWALVGGEAFVYGLYSVYYNAPEKLIAINQKLIKALHLFGDDFSSFPYKQISFLHESNAFMYTKLGNEEKAAEEVKMVRDIFAESNGSYEPFNDLLLFDKNDETAFSFVKTLYQK